MALVIHDRMTFVCGAMERLTHNANRIKSGTPLSGASGRVRQRLGSRYSGTESHRQRADPGTQWD
jgi:hypothetical protein